MSEYATKMLAAFIDKPEKEAWFEHAFSQYSVNGVDKMSWVWSWWALAGGPLYLLYRKAYFAAGILFAVMILISVIPFGSIVISILAGGYANYFVYKLFQTKRKEIETTISEEEIRIETMRKIGGYHSWVIWLSVVIFVLWLTGVLVVAGVIGSI